VTSAHLRCFFALPVPQVSRIGEDLLDIRIDFFVYKKNRKADMHMGRISNVSLGMGHEMALINELAAGVFEQPPFPSVQKLVGIDKGSDIYEHHGFEYGDYVRDKEAARKAEEARLKAAAAAAAGAAAGSSSSAAPPAAPPATGARLTAARKGVTHNLLNAAPLKPSTAEEIELMLKVTLEAEKAKGNGKKKKGQTVWQLAEDAYRKAFITNCAAPEEERILIRAPTTWQMIKQASTHTWRAHTHTRMRTQTQTPARAAPAPTRARAAHAYSARVRSACARAARARTARAPTCDVCARHAQTYEEMAKRHRERMAEARAQPAEPAQPAESDVRALQEAAELLLRVAAPPGAAEGASESAPGAEEGARARARVKPERAAHGRARWAEQIEAGRVLRSHEIEGLGQKGLSAYLRAMDIKVGKEMQRDAPGMRDMLRKRLRELNTHEWSVPSKAQKS
jgi:hypothetical protein